jgi:hypothetical protein
MISNDKNLFQIKRQLGKIKFLNFADTDLVSGHRMLGNEVKPQVQNILKRKLDILEKSRFEEEMTFIRDCQNSLIEKSKSAQVHPKIRTGIDQYIHCLRAWAYGAKLNEFSHPMIDGNKIDEFKLALWLQNDNGGCQTGVYRDGDQSVIIWHTEEDVEYEPSARFDKLRIASFSATDEGKEVIITSLIYPDLLPGPAFNWRNGNFVQAVDALYIDHKKASGKMLSNIACWLTLRSGDMIDSRDIIETLGPYIDGYATTIVKRKPGGKISAVKLEFAGDIIYQSNLMESPTHYLFQVNVCSLKNSELAKMEDIDSNYRIFFEERIERTSQLIRASENSDMIKQILFTLLPSTDGGDFAYSNKDVKGYFVARMSDSGLEMWMDGGPATAKDNPMAIKIPVS